MMEIRITTKDATCITAKVVIAEDGVLRENWKELEHIASLDIHLRPDKENTADVRFTCLGPLDVFAMVTVSEEHLRELALAHGYKLVREGLFTPIAPERVWDMMLGKFIDV